MLLFSVLFLKILNNCNLFYVVIFKLINRNSYKYQNSLKNMKTLTNFLIMLPIIGCLGCYDNEKQKMQQEIYELRANRKEDSLKRADLEKENKKILELCGKKEKPKKEQNTAKERKKIIYSEPKKIQADKNSESLISYQKENSILDTSKTKKSIFYPPKIDSLALAQENEKIEKNFVSFLLAKGVYDRKKDGTMDLNKIWYFKQFYYEKTNFNVSVNFVKGVNLNVILNHTKQDWESWNDENADGKIDFYGKGGLTEGEEPFENFSPEKQNEILGRLTKLKSKIMEDAKWKYK